ncbi:hypothetical protein ACFFK0_27830 [Paenibacillus chartarius]|uniref:Uncharacterized protein n=1 Tax=Paenibacillus chartarius TaxID=747481 RepID=A0ABV6DUA0_9BACL
MSKKTLKQKQQAMLDETSSAQSVKSNKLTQNEAKFKEPNRPSI